MARYGIPYTGSKQKMADEIVGLLPSGKRFVDLFGGGFAMSECALLSGKYESVFYNEKNPIVVDAIHKAISGEFQEYYSRFVSREEFAETKETDGIVSLCGSFGNNVVASYLYGERVENDKLAGHEFVFNGTPIDGLDFQTDETEPKKRRIALCSFAKKEFDRIMSSIPELRSEYQKYLRIVNNKALPPIHAVEFTTWLKSTGITAKEVNDLTESQMSSHYLCTKVDSQPAIPTEEQFEKLRKSPKIRDVPQDILDLVYDTEKVKKLKYLDKMQHLEHLEHLQRLEHLERLQHLEHLERLRDRIELNCGDYRDYTSQTGDVVYCDPPYDTGVGYTVGAFDFSGFLDWVASRPFPVYFSSYPISDERFTLLWSKETRTTFSSASNGLKRTECLYTNKQDLLLQGWI